MFLLQPVLSNTYLDCFCCLCLILPGMALKLSDIMLSSAEIYLYGYLFICFAYIFYFACVCIVTLYPIPSTYEIIITIVFCYIYSIAFYNQTLL